MKTTAYIGLGSNLDNPQQQLITALEELRGLPQSRPVMHSRLYRSAPVGPPGQPDYVNAVAQLETSLPPERLLDELQAIEQAHLRRRTIRWGPRTLDLDILLYGDQQIDTPRLKVPHPFLDQRSFVIYPLSELSPELMLPDGRSLAELRRHCPMGSLEPIGV